MEPSDVKQKWPNEYAIAEGMISDGESVITAIRKMRENSDIDLIDSKRIIVALQSNVSLEEHQENIIPALKQAFEEIDGDNG